MHIRKFLILSMALIILLVLLASCERSNEVVNVRMGSWPDRIVYIVDIDTEIDMTGATVITILRDGREEEESVTGGWSAVVHNIDFSTPGVYEVTIIRPVTSKEFTFRFPVQVIDWD